MQMITTRTCPQCGWVYPISYIRPDCKWCNTVINFGMCHKCHTVRDLVDGTYCLACSNALTLVEEYARHLDLRRIRLKDRNSRLAPQLALYDRKTTPYGYHAYWLTAIDRVPQDYHTLTEEEWLQACDYFKGCATCGSPSINVRYMFIPFQDNGRYCNYNVIPICDNCAIQKHHVNPFIWLTNKSTDFEAAGVCLERIKAYLIPILQAATTWEEFKRVNEYSE